MSLYYKLVAVHQEGQEGLIPQLLAQPFVPFQLKLRHWLVSTEPSLSCLPALPEYGCHG